MEKPINYGSKFKAYVYVEPLDDTHISEVDFSVTFYVNQENRRVKLSKEQMFCADDDTYIAPLDSVRLGKGKLMAEVIMEIPDKHFDDGFRHTVIVVPSDIRIV